jgi:Glycosyl transferase family 2
MGAAVSRQDPRRAVGAVGVVLPVHDEEELLPGALEALEVAANALAPTISCRVAVVLDDCGDASSAIACSWRARYGGLVIGRMFRSVGLARHTGSLALLSLWPDKDPAQVWLATTDADSQVPRDWLTVQVDAYMSGTDLWAGRVRVAEQSATVRRWTKRYASEPGPIHGASLGFSAALYGQLGGFRNLRSGEDRDLHHRAASAGFRIKHDLRAAVTTSSRRKGRAPGGFASVLDTAAEEQFEASSQRS